MKKLFENREKNNSYKKYYINNEFNYIKLLNKIGE